MYKTFLALTRVWKMSISKFLNNTTAPNRSALVKLEATTTLKNS